MAITLLQTKLYMPPLRPELVSRPRLLERLKTGLQSKLTLVAAPAGYGKTTLVIEGVRSSQMPVGWLTLDEDDNDLTLFWLYVISAMQTVQADIGKSALGLLQLPQVPPIEYVITTIINEINEVREEFALVLDDYHKIETQPVHDTVNFLLNHLPPQAHLIITSRTDPPVPLAHVRAQNQLVEVRAADLRFTSEEAAAFLNNIMGLELSNEDVAALEFRTEGWIASLQLAAVSMQGRKDISAFIADFSGSSRYIMDYLIEEVLLRQEPGTQSFLLETAILDRFTASLCNAVTWRNDSREKLAQLEATNLFLVPLDDKRQWYRYHHLFADLLRNQLLQSQQGRMTELHFRASQWFEQEGLISEAIYHAWNADNVERTANLIESVALTMVMQSYGPTVLGWIEKLPKKLVDDRPWLCYASAVAHQYTGQHSTVEPLLQRAESAMNRAEEAQPDISFPDHVKIRGRIATIRTSIALNAGELQSTIEQCHEALEHIPDQDLVSRATVTGNLGISLYWNGNLPTAKRYLEESNTLSQAANFPFYSMFVMCFLGDCHLMEGDLHQAAQKYEEAIQIGMQWGDGEPLPVTGHAYVCLSHIFHEWNYLEKAIAHASIGAKLAEMGGIVVTILLGYSLLAWHNQTYGCVEAAVEALDQIKRIPLETVTPHPRRHSLALQARLSILQGDLNATNRWLNSWETELNLQHVPDFWSELPYLTLVRLHLAQGKVDEIPGLLDNLAQKVEAEQRTGSLIEILALQSIAFQAQGELDQAVDTLERALSLAEPEGYVRTFVDEGEPMARLLRLAASRGIAKKYARRLLASFHPGAKPQPTVLSAEGAVAPSPLVEPLSERELKVLQLIVDGMSNREIAEKLIIGVSTAKTHINNIFRKLDVQSRTQAIARSRELKLL